MCGILYPDLLFYHLMHIFANIFGVLNAFLPHKPSFVAHTLLPSLHCHSFFNSFEIFISSPCRKLVSPLCPKGHLLLIFFYILTQGHA